MIQTSSPAPTQMSLPVMSEQVTLKGRTAFKGKVTAPLFILTSPNEIKDFPQGAILVAEKTTPEFTAVFSKVSGIITQIGGVLSHAAIISRELKVPCIVGVSDLLAHVFDGQTATLDAENGVVILTSIPKTFEKETGTAKVEKAQKSLLWCDWCSEYGHEKSDCENCKWCEGCDEYVDNDHEHEYSEEE